MNTTCDTSRFGPAADQELASLYDSVGASTIEHKINALKLRMKGDSMSDPNFYAFGGQVTHEMILGCLEHEYLSNRGLIDLALA